VEQVDENLEGLADDRVGLASLDVDDEADATGVVLVAGIVEALGGRLAGVRRLLRHPCIPPASFKDAFVRLSIAFVKSCTILLAAPALVITENSYSGYQQD